MARNTIALALMFIPVFVATGLASAEVTTLDDAIAAISEHEIPTVYVAEYESIVTAGQMKQTMKGKIFSDPPRNKRIAEISMGPQTATITMVNGSDEILWIENRMGPGVQVIKADRKAGQELTGEDDLNGLPVAAGNSTSYMINSEMWAVMQNAMNLRFDGIESVAGDDTYVISGEYKESFIRENNTNGELEGLNLESILFTIYFRATDSFPVKHVAQLRDGSFESITTETNVNLNPIFSDDEFVYTPPAGVAVIDMVEMTRNQMEAAENQ